MNRKLALLVITVAVIAVLSVALVGTTSAQPAVRCDELSRTSVVNNSILVDVPSASRLGFEPGNVQCTLLALNAQFRPVTSAGGSIGTPREGQTLNRSDFFNDYGVTFAAVDVWIAGDASGANFGFFGTPEGGPAPVRICFRSNDTDLARSPGEGTPGEVARYIVFNDARYYSSVAAATRGGNFTTQDQPERVSVNARNQVQLDIVPEGLELGYICADIDVPGTVSLIDRLPVRPETSPIHPNAPQEAPQRCAFDTSSGTDRADCRN